MLGGCFGRNRSASQQHNRFSLTKHPPAYTIQAVIQPASPRGGAFSARSMLFECSAVFAAFQKFILYGEGNRAIAVRGAEE
jgi:hypothetical protein